MTKGVQLFFRLVILDLAVMLPMDWSILRDISKRTSTVSHASILGVELLLLIANFAITWKVVRERGIVPFVVSGWRRYEVWAAWVVGPLLVASFPLVIATSIVKPTFDRIVWSFIWLHLATSAFGTVRRSQEGEVKVVSTWTALIRRSK